MNDAEPVIYTPHSGTLRISGKTVPLKAASCAWHFLSEGRDEIDFFYIGGNSGQQAMKAMTIFCYLVERETEGKVLVSFKPIRVFTMVKEGNALVKKDATVWKTMLNQEKLY